MAGDARVAAMLAFRRLFEDDDFSAQIMSGDRRGDTGCSKPDHDDIGFHIPILLHSGLISRLTRLHPKRDIAIER